MFGEENIVFPKVLNEELKEDREENMNIELSSSQVSL
jgi:hypothetical protein